MAPPSFLPRRLRAVFDRWGMGSFASDAALIFLLNFSSRVVLFFGAAYAARCLGPVNLGVSAQVQAAVQQASLGFHGGFDSIAVRRVAAEPGLASRILQLVVALRVALALLLCGIWVAGVLAWVAPGPLRQAWLLGAPLLLLAALNTTFFFQAIERLPLHTAIVTAGAAATAVGYFVFIAPGATAGADLWVLVAASGCATLVALACAWRMALPSRWTSHERQAMRSELGVLFRQGYRFWLLAILVYFYANFTVLLVAWFHGDAAAGIYRAALLMASAVELLFASINNLLFTRLMQWGADGPRVLWRRQSELVPSHVAIGIAVGIVSVAAAPLVFPLVLGPEFAATTTLFQVLVIGRVIVFVGQIYAWGLVALHLDGVFLRITLVGCAISILSNLALIPVFGLIGAAWVSALVELLICSSCFFAQRHHLHVHS